MSQWPNGSGAEWPPVISLLFYLRVFSSQLHRIHIISDGLEVRSSGYWVFDCHSAQQLSLMSTKNSVFSFHRCCLIRSVSSIFYLFHGEVVEELLRLWLYSHFLMDDSRCDCTSMMALWGATGSLRSNESRTASFKNLGQVMGMQNTPASTRQLIHPIFWDENGSK